MKKSEEGPSLIKQLASCDKSIRDKTLATILDVWLPYQSEISDEDMRKLWQGIFYCVWHADKPAVQSQLIDRLSSVLLSLPLPLSRHYFSVFLQTMRREWSRIDGLRLDKFYLLIRRFLHCFFDVLRKHSWNLELSRLWIGVLVENSFLADDKFQGNGVNYHIAAVFVEELKSFLPVGKDVLEIVLMPFVAIVGDVSEKPKNADKILVGKIKSNVFNVLLNNGKKLLESKKSGADIASGDDTIILGEIALSMGFSNKLYEMGSHPNCCQGNRKTLFSLHEDFLKLEKDLESSGVEISIPEVTVVEAEEDDEVPDLIPISSEVEMSDSIKNTLNKCSQGKKKTGKKSKKKNKKKATSDDIDEDTENVAAIPNGMNSNNEQRGGDSSNSLTLSESAKSNLQAQFEKVAAEEGLENDGTTDCLHQPDATTNGKASKKRKKRKNSGDEVGQMSIEKSSEKSAKKVRFSMKNNIVWKPQSPLPPQSLRLPPSVIPRGSALKKGLSPGPVREMPNPAKPKPKRKVRKVVKVSDTIKRLRMLNALPTLPLDPVRKSTGQKKKASKGERSD